MLVKSNRFALLDRNNSKEIDKEIARSIVDDDEKLGTIFDEIESKAEIGEFTQDEVEQEEEVTAEPIQ